MSRTEWTGDESFSLVIRLAKQLRPARCQRRTSPITADSVNVANGCRSDSSTLAMIVCRRDRPAVLLVRPVLRAWRLHAAFVRLRCSCRRPAGFHRRRGDRRGGDEREQLLVQHQPHQLIAQQPIVVLRSFQCRQFGRPHRPTQFENFVVQFGDFPRAARVAQPLVACTRHAAR